MISSDKNDLKWYFSYSYINSILLGAGASSFGYQLERAALYSFGSTKCKKCLGSGFLKKTIFKGKELTDKQRMILAALDIYADELPPPVEDACQVCHGLGIVPSRARFKASSEVTVRSTGSSQLVGAVEEPEPDVASMARHRRISRILVGVSQNKPIYLEALRRHNEQGGSIIDLWGLTDHGRKLLRGKPKSKTETQFFLELRRTESQTSDTLLKIEINGADKEANRLIKKAEEAYVECARPKLRLAVQL